MPNAYVLRDLTRASQRMSDKADNEPLAMVLNYVAIGALIYMGNAFARQAWRGAFDQGRYR